MLPRIWLPYPMAQADRWTRPAQTASQAGAPRQEARAWNLELLRLGRPTAAAATSRLAASGATRCGLWTSAVASSTAADPDPEPEPEPAHKPKAKLESGPGQAREPELSPHQALPHAQQASPAQHHNAGFARMKDAKTGWHSSAPVLTATLARSSSRCLVTHVLLPRTSLLCAQSWVWPCGNARRRLFTSSPSAYPAAAAH